MNGRAIGRDIRWAAQTAVLEGVILALLVWLLPGVTASGPGAIVLTAVLIAAAEAVAWPFLYRLAARFHPLIFPALSFVFAGVLIIAVTRGADRLRDLPWRSQVEVAEGETGELAARGPYTIRGYLAAPDRDRDAFTAEGFYRSGDLVRARRYEGTLSYSIEGRVKDLIDRGGEKINAEEVELLVAGHPAVAEIALVAMPDPRLGERGCAYVVPRDPQDPPTLADICAYLEAEGLAKYKWPERLELIDALPRTQVGKVSKVTLRADIGAKLERETTPRRPAVTA